MRKPNGFSNCGHGDSSSPALVANKVPRAAVSHVIQNLPDHNACAFERGFAVADIGVGHNIFTQFNAPMFSILHGIMILAVRENNKQDARSNLPCLSYKPPILDRKCPNFCFNFSPGNFILV